MVIRKPRLTVAAMRAARATRAKASVLTSKLMRASGTPTLCKACPPTGPYIAISRKLYFNGFGPSQKVCPKYGISGV